MGQSLPVRPGVRSAGRARRFTGALVVTALSFTAACGEGSGDEPEAGGGGDGPVAVDVAAALGPEGPASGEPVPIGFVSDGRGPAIDNTFEIVAAEGAVSYINDYRGGIAGRPIELVSCETRFDPARAADCANQLVQEEVAAVVMPGSVTALEIYEVTRQNGIPLFVYGVGNATLLLDDETMFSLVDPIGGLADSPISVAEENDLGKVTAIVVDVPPATAFYETIAPDTFEEAGLGLELVAIPPDQADMTPQMVEIANGEPTAVHIVGPDTFCIAAIDGLHAAGFDGPISMLSGSCDTDAVQTALGEGLEGVYVSSATANGDLEEEGIARWNAIIEEYGVDIDAEKGLPTYITVMSLRLALEGLTGEVAPETVLSTVRDMEPTLLPGGAGIEFRCNGNARPLMPAVRTNGSLRSQLGEDGEPTLPWSLVGNDPIPE